MSLPPASSCLLGALSDLCLLDWMWLLGLVVAWRCGPAPQVQGLDLAQGGGGAQLCLLHHDQRQDRPQRHPGEKKKQAGRQTAEEARGRGLMWLVGFGAGVMMMIPILGLHAHGEERVDAVGPAPR